MKNLLFSAVVVWSLISCNNADTGKAKTDSAKDGVSESDMNQNILVYKALETGDFKNIDTLLSDDMIDHGGGPNGTDIKGRDSVKAGLMKMHGTYKIAKYEVLANSYDSGYLFTMAHLVAIPIEKPGEPMPKKIDGIGIDVVKIKNHKATDHWTYLEPKEVMKMMGNSKDPGESKKK